MCTDPRYHDDFKIRIDYRISSFAMRIPERDATTNERREAAVTTTTAGPGHEARRPSVTVHTFRASQT